MIKAHKTGLLPELPASSKEITIPSINSILGDKITTLAPNTIGIPYFKGSGFRGVEIAKQTFDIGNLFDHANDFALVKESFINTAMRELIYHDQSGGIDSVIDDSFAFAKMVCIRNQTDPGFEVVQAGIKRLGGYLLTKRFYIEEAMTDLSKMALLLSAIKTDNFNTEKFNSQISVDDFIIKNAEFSKLNKLKKILPEAFYYWYNALRLQEIL